MSTINVSVNGQAAASVNVDASKSFGVSVGGSSGPSIVATNGDTVNLTISQAGAPGGQGVQGPAGKVNLSDATPLALGAASAGSSANAARGDHVHPVPTIAYANLSGIPSTFTPAAHNQAASTITGLANVATSGSASDLSTGTLPAARLPAATGSTLGGIKVGSGLTIVSGVLSTTGGGGSGNLTLSSSTPAALGTASAGTASTAARGDHVHALPTIAYANLSGIPSTFTPSAHNQAASTITGLAAIATSGSASNLTSGTVPVARLPLATNSTAGAVIVGSGLTVSNGTISATAGGGGSGSSPSAPTGIYAAFDGNTGSVIYWTISGEVEAGYWEIQYSTDSGNSWSTHFYVSVGSPNSSLWPNDQLPTGTSTGRACYGPAALSASYGSAWYRIRGYTASLASGEWGYSDGASESGGSVGFSSAPESPTSNGTAGSLAYDAGGYLYLCYAADTWGRVQVQSWLPFTRALLHGDGATIVDSSSLGLTCTTGGTGAALSTSHSKFGGSSLSFSGAGYVAVDATPDLYIDTGDFCVEMWVRFNATNAFLPFAQSRNNVGTADSSNWWFGYTGQDATPQLFFGQHSTGNGCGVNWSPSANTWYHVAATRQSGTVRLFIDGVLQSSSGGETLSESSFQGSGLAIGAITTPAYFDGYIDEFRLSVGAARYTATFTPATSAFTS